MSDLCEFKNILGEPKKGMHVHYFGFAIIDLLLTIIVAFVLMLCVKKYININISHSLTFGIILLIFLLMGEYFHIKFCIK